jgi:hypothetical protein
VRPLATSAAFVSSAAVSRVIHSSCLLACVQCFFLVGGDEAFHLPPGLLMNFSDLLLFLLRSER